MPTIQGIEFTRVVNAVDDLGFDPTGQEPINLDGEVANDTLIDFPPGTYLVSGNVVDSDVSNFGIRGIGSSRGDVSFTTPRGDGIFLFTGQPPGPLLFENFVIDERDDDVTAIAIKIDSIEGSILSNVEWVGVTPLDDRYPQTYQLSSAALRSDTVNLIENVYAGLDAPAVQAEYPSGTEFLFQGPSHKGETIMRGCAIHERNSNATRSTNADGVLTIEDCEFVNNQNANIRFGAGRHSSKVSSARRCYVKVDGSRDGMEDAVRLDGPFGDEMQSGAIIENVEIDWTQNSGRGVIALPDWGEHGGVVFRDCVVRNDGDNTLTINADNVGSGDTAIIVEGCDFTGSGLGFDADNRPGSVIRDSCIDMPNASINGFSTENISTTGCRKPLEDEPVNGDQPDGEPMGAINLADEGLSQGDDVTPYFDEFFRSGNTIFIPAGTYRISNPTSALSREVSDAGIIGSDDGVVLERDPPDPGNKYRPFIRASGGVVRFENFTVKGISLGRQVDDSDRWRFDATDSNARIEVVNVNFPDGTEECSDAIAFYTGSHHEGTVVYKNCYIRGFGNSGFYVNQGYSSGRTNPVIMDNCVIVDCPNIRAGTNGSEYRNCTFAWRESLPGWIDCTKLARGIRWDNGGNDMVVENCHFYFEPTSVLGHGVGGAMEFENFNHGGVVRDIFIYNPNSDKMIKDKGGLDGSWTFSNINVVGPGNKNIDAPVSVGSTAPDMRNEGIVWMPESQTVIPGGDGGTVPTPTPGDGGVPEGYSLLEIISTTSGEDIVYEFVVDGDVIPATGRNSRITSVGEENVDIVDNGDGTMTVTGKTGNEYGDAFAVKGTITSFERISGNSEVEIFIDGGDETDRFLGDGAGDRNVPPSARFSVAEDGMTLHLDASESNDPDGSIVRYDWHIGEESRSGRIVSIDVGSPGIYDVTLTVEDDDGATATTAKTIEVEDVRDPGDGFQHYILLETPSNGSFDVGFEVLGTAVLGPESGSSDSIDSNLGSAESVDGAVHVTAGDLAPDGEDDFFYNGYIWDFDPPSGEEVFFTIDNMDRMSVHDFPSDDVFAAVMDSRIEGLVAELDASRSRLADFTLDRYLWRVNGMELSGENVTLQFEEPGDYPLELWLLTEEGIADPLFTTLTVSLPDGEFPPRADFRYSTDGLNVSFDASMSLDPNGDIKEYVWDFGLSSDTSPKVDYTFPMEGEYNVTLMVYDKTGRVDTMTKSVTVSE